MRALAIKIEADGRLRVPPEAVIPPDAHLAVLLLERTEEDNLSAHEIGRLAQASGSLDFLKDEPDIYTDADIEPGERNPDFAGDAPTR